MKYTTFLSTLLICLFFGSCGDDKEPQSKRKDIPKNIAWIEDTMRDHYYWYKDIPSEDRLDYTLNEKDFFMSLLSESDGKKYITSSGTRHNYFSNIKNLSDPATYSIRSSSGQGKISYGFELMSVYTNPTHTNMQLLVQYVLKDSPAEESGIKRGDWITHIEDKPITSSDFSAILNGGGEVTLIIQRWDSERKRHVTVPEKINLPAAREVLDNPIHTAKVITTPSKGKKVGYLVYNHFTKGISDNDNSYDNELRKLSGTTFDGVDEFVLDLRYNGGGYISSAAILCAILAPKATLGKPLCYLKYNDKSYPKESVINAGEDLLKPNGKNLNLSTLYVLVSSSSASASEMLINSLRPYMKEVVIIGEQTLGKNVASNAYTSSDKAWEINPIICIVYNSERNADYANGFPPDYKLNEAFTPTLQDPNIVTLDEVRELGDENERLLRVALNLIDGTDSAPRSAELEKGPFYTVAPFNSISHRATNGTIIDID